jgi:hypothetical protein
MLAWRSGVGTDTPNQTRLRRRLLSPATFHICTSSVDTWGCRGGTTDTFPQVNVSAPTHPLRQNTRSEHTSRCPSLFLKTHAREGTLRAAEPRGSNPPADRAPLWHRRLRVRPRRAACGPGTASAALSPALARQGTRTSTSRSGRPQWPVPRDGLAAVPLPHLRTPHDTWPSRAAPFLRLNESADSIADAFRLTLPCNSPKRRSLNSREAFLLSFVGSSSLVGVCSHGPI